MKKVSLLFFVVLIFFALLLVAAPQAFARGHGVHVKKGHGLHINHHSGGFTQGYFKKDGHYVAPYYRAR